MLERDLLTVLLFCVMGINMLLIFILASLLNQIGRRTGNIAYVAFEIVALFIGGSIGLMLLLMFFRRFP